MKPKIPPLSEIVRIVYDKNALVLGRGSESHVIAITDSVVAKVYYNMNEVVPTEKRAKNEFELGRYFRSKGVSVPEMYTLIPRRTSPKRLSSQKTRHWILLMERIHGYDLEHIPGYLSDELIKEMIKEIFEKKDKELAQVRALGYNPENSERHSNTMYDPSTKRVYLIDFTTWRKK